MNDQQPEYGEYPENDQENLFNTDARQTFSRPDYTDEDETIYERFLRYHDENPDVLNQIIKRCEKVRRSGEDSWSISNIVEQLRWHYGIEVQGDHEFAISNDYRAIYARLVMKMFPDRFEGFFVTKEREAAKREPNGWIEDLANEERSKRGLEPLSFDDDGEGSSDEQKDGPDAPSLESSASDQSNTGTGADISF